MKSAQGFDASPGDLMVAAMNDPDYQNAAKVIPATGTLLGQPQPQGTNELVFELFLPSGARPAGARWPRTGPSPMLRRWNSS